jgi:hypothetical protein
MNFRNFVSLDIADMLDQVRKFGLFTILAHQRFGQLDENITDAVLTNCRIKAVFGGLTAAAARLMAEELFINKLDPEKIKVAIYQTKFWPTEETRQVRTRSTSHASSSGWMESSAAGNLSGSSTGEFFGPEQWFGPAAASGTSAGLSSGASRMSGSGSSGSDSYGESESVADIPVFVPVPFRELSSVQYFSVDEQLTKLTAALKEQYARHCFIKIQNEETEPMLVPKVEQSYASPKNVRWYEDKMLAKSNALTTAAVDQMLIDQERNFLDAPGEVINITPAPAEGEPEPLRPAARRKAKPPEPNIFDDLLGKT